MGLVIGLTCVGFVIGAILAIARGTRRSKAVAPSAEQLIFASYRGMCASCGRAISPGSQIWWLKGSPVRHANCQQASRSYEADVVQKAINKLEGAKGPASRHVALATALEKISSAETRQQLMLEASRIEVSAVLDKVDSLKTSAAKRRHITAALESIKHDEIPDELQQDSIGWLNDELAKLD
jgi:hypothetical protein